MYTILNDPIRGLCAVVDKISPEISFNINDYGLFLAFPGFVDNLTPMKEFCATLEPSEHADLIDMYVKSKWILLTMQGDPRTITNSISFIFSIITATFGKLSLSQRILNFVVYNTNIRIPRSNLPEGASFTQADWHKVMALAIAMKIMMPILGGMLNLAAGEDSDVIMNYMIEVNTALVIFFDDIIASLQYYVSAVVLKTSAEFDMELTWQDLRRIGQTCFAVLIIKYLPYANLYGDNSNVAFCVEGWVPELMTSEDL